MSNLTLSFQGQELREFSIHRGSLFIGSDPECGVHIEDGKLQPKHARIDTEDQVSVLHNLSMSSEATPVLVKGQAIQQYTLKDGDVIQLGQYLLTYRYIPIKDDDDALLALQPELETEPQTSAQSEEGQRPGWLQILNGQNLGKTLSLNRSMTNLGKPGVATALITRRSEGYYISHLEGKKTPLVGDTPIGDQNYKLNDGDTIQIGNVKMQFYLE